MKTETGLRLVGLSLITVSFFLGSGENAFGDVDQQILPVPHCLNATACDAGCSASSPGCSGGCVAGTASCDLQCGCVAYGSKVITCQCDT